MLSAGTDGGQTWQMIKLGTSQVFCEGTTHTKKTAATLRWDGDDLILDNTEVYISGVMWKYFGWVFELSLNMGWLEVDESVGRYDGTPGRYRKGPNMRLIPFDPKGPWADYTQESFSDASIYPRHANDFSNGPINVVTEGTGWPRVNQGGTFMVMAKAFNWRFVRLNEAVGKFKHTPVAVQAVERPLYVLVDLIETEWVDGAYDELLRTVPYKKGDEWWEPRHVQYHNHRGQGIEIARIRVNEVNGTKAVFGSSVTHICLHFRKKRDVRRRRRCDSEEI